MTKPTELLTRKDTLLLGSFGAFVASLCCFSPILLFLLGISTASFAGALGNRLFFEYWWAFIGMGIASMTTAFYVLLRKRHNICSIDDFNKKRVRIINSALLLLLTFFVIYIIWELILEIIGIKLGLWSLETLKAYLIK